MCNFWIENIVRRETRNFIAEQRRKTKTPTHFFLLFRSGKRPVILGISSVTLPKAELRSSGGFRHLPRTGHNRA
jgi:hypothetical protein